ncbi:hypothetical protein BC629DRAFT_1494899 [Irpex lacteus]|nr:hypothetical protein BC629DRAFT_1494899 [Irpex lacteus]
MTGLQNARSRKVGGWPLYTIIIAAGPHSAHTYQVSRPFERLPRSLLSTPSQEDIIIVTGPVGRIAITLTYARIRKRIVSPFRTDPPPRCLAIGECASRQNSFWRRYSDIPKDCLQEVKIPFVRVEVRLLSIEAV